MIPMCRTSLGQSSCSFKGAHSWNALPDGLKLLYSRGNKIGISSLLCSEVGLSVDSHMSYARTKHTHTCAHVWCVLSACRLHAGLC